MTSTQIRTHAHTHAARRDSRTDIHSPACSAFGNHRGTWPTSRAARALRALRVLRAGYASESRGSLTGEARLAGSDGAPLGGSERGRACNVTPAATPPSESRTDAQGVAQRAPFPAGRSFGRQQGGRGPRADGAGRTFEGGGDAGGRTGAHRARSARRDRRPLVLVPYLKNAFVPVTTSRKHTPPVDSPCHSLKRRPSPGPSPVVAGPLVAESSFLNPPEGAGRLSKRWKDGGRGGCEKDAIRADAAVRPQTCRIPQPPCFLSVNSESSELPQLLTVTQVGQRLSICRRTVERLIATQQLRACKIGRATRIAVAEVVRYVKSLHPEPSTTGGAP